MGLTANAVVAGTNEEMRAAQIGWMTIEHRPRARPDITPVGFKALAVRTKKVRRPSSGHLGFTHIVVGTIDHRAPPALSSWLAEADRPVRVRDFFRRAPPAFRLGVSIERWPVRARRCRRGS